MAEDEEGDNLRERGCPQPWRSSEAMTMARRARQALDGLPGK
jgi:hypothetical protein